MRKRIIALPTIVLAIGAFFVYLGLRLYFFPRVRGQFLVGAAFTMFGALIIAIVGITLILLSVISKPKKMRSPTSRRATKKRKSTIIIFCAMFAVLKIFRSLKGKAGGIPFGGVSPPSPKEGQKENEKWRKRGKYG